MDKVSNIPPQHPRGCQVFLKSDGGDHAKKNDWSCNGYSCVNKEGYGVHKKNQTGLSQIYSLRIHSGDQKGCDDFVRRVYFKKDSTLKLVEYLGDETKYVPRPHGNQKDPHGDYRRTLPANGKTDTYK